MDPQTPKKKKSQKANAEVKKFDGKFRQLLYLIISSAIKPSLESTPSGT